MTNLWDERAALIKVVKDMIHFKAILLVTGSAVIQMLVVNGMNKTFISFTVYTLALTLPQGSADTPRSKPLHQSHHVPFSHKRYCTLITHLETPTWRATYVNQSLLHYE